MQNREKKLIKTFFFGFILLIFASFILFQSKNLLTGPKITIDYPSDGQTVEESLTQISGRTKNISEIKLNGRNIFVNEKGNFEEKILLSYGYNNIVIEAKDRFNRKTKEKLELVLK